LGSDAHRPANEQDLRNDEREFWCASPVAFGSGGTRSDYGLRQLDAAAGLDSNSGALEAPLKTIGRALEVWTEGQVIVLRAGTYSAASGEAWGYSFPDGLDLQPNTDGVVLRGTPTDVAFTFDGGGTVQHLTFEGFGTALSASTGTQSITGVHFDGNESAIELVGDASMTVSDYSAFTDGAVANVAASASLAITTATMEQLSPTDQGAALVISGGAQLELSGLVLDEVHTAFVRANDSSVVELADSTMTNSGAEAGLIAAWGSSQITLTDFGVTGTTDGPVIAMEGESTALFIAGGSYSAAELTAIRGHGTMIISGASFSSNVEGAIRVASGGAATVTGCLFEDNNVGVTVEDDAEVTVRDTVFSQNWEAITAIGSLPDLGVVGDEGGNTFTSSELHSNISVKLGLSGTFQAAGNRWDLDTQGSDSTGHYPEQLISGPYSGGNYSIPTGVIIQL